MKAKYCPCLSVKLFAGIVTQSNSSAPLATESAGKAGALPDFVPPQLTALTETTPEGGDWAHELKWDGYRMHARIDAEDVRLLTRTGLDSTEKYPAIVDALRALPIKQAYLDGELCALSVEGLTSFS